ncbi:acetyl-CoA carboxylase biotin carboxyl carrier protein [Gottfriedia acidiceleris]|uniref:acetyl-CoA carboxylase biotin carboxyl carrier protein n=1 Tax=Gottfriedia acidiceleris TaxID=371036 RepID=UPI003D1D32E7
MVKMLELREMVRLVDQSSLEKLEVKNRSLRIFIKKGEVIQINPVGEPSIQLMNVVEKQGSDNSDEFESELEASIKPHVIHSINVGIFQSIVKLGDKVEIGSLIGYCTVKALNLKFDIKSDQHGAISEVLEEEGQLIDYGQPLYKISVGKEILHV